MAHGNEHGRREKGSNQDTFPIWNVPKGGKGKHSREEERHKDKDSPRAIICATMEEGRGFVLLEL